MRTVGSFQWDGVEMQALMPSEPIEVMLFDIIAPFAYSILACHLTKVFPLGRTDCVLHVPHNDGESFAALPVPGRKDWRMFLGTDGTGEIGVFVDTGENWQESNILEVTHFPVMVAGSTYSILLQDQAPASA